MSRVVKVINVTGSKSLRDTWKLSSMSRVVKVRPIRGNNIFHGDPEANVFYIPDLDRNILQIWGFSNLNIFSIIILRVAWSFRLHFLLILQKIQIKKMWCSGDIWCGWIYWIKMFMTCEYYYDTINLVAMWHSWLMCHSNDQKIMGLNPGWICHSGGLGKSPFPLPLNTKEVKTFVQWGQWWYYQLISSVRQWAARLYAPCGVEMESGINRPNDLG